MQTSRNQQIYLFLFSAFLLLGSISLACNLPAGLQERFLGSAGSPTPTPLPTNTPQPLPPTVVETDPPLGSTISLDGPVTVYFNQAMDQASVAEAFSTDPAVGASLEWVDPATLQILPGEDFPAGETVQLLFAPTARAANGLQMPEGLSLQYYTPADLEMVTVLPAPGSIEVDPLSAIVVAFNQPVVTLGDSPGEAPAAFALNPAPAGEGEWINTSTYQFSPRPGLSGGTTYQVQISRDLVSTAGTMLIEESLRNWSFSTAYPEVLNWEPYDGDIGVPLDQGIRFQFSQAMDADSVADNFSLASGTGAAILGEWTWSDDGQEGVFQPDQLFSRGANYAAVLPAETRSAGGTPLGLDTQFSFQTTGEFQFLGTPSGQNYTTSIYEGATLYFNNPVDIDLVEENISFSPPVPNLWPSAGASGSVLNLYGDFEPLTDYTLFLDASLRDSWGSELGEGVSLTFTTEALSPNLTVTQGNNVLFLTGSENAIPARGTNLYQVSLNTGAIPPDDIPIFFGPGLYTTLDEYFPPDTTSWTEVLNVPGDAVYSVNLPLNQQGRPLDPGLYRYQIYSQEIPYNPSPYLVVVSDVHLTMKTSPEDLLIWALDLSTGEAVREAEVTVYDQDGEEIFSGQTNDEGVFQAEFPAPIDLYETTFYAVTGEQGSGDFGITASTWAFGIEAYNFGLQTNYGAPQPQTYIYTDRPIYRPGQTVNYRLIHRDPLGGGYKLPEEGSITVSIFQSGMEEQQQTLQLSDFGTAAGALELSLYAQPGYYRLETDHGMTLFRVAEYRKPEIDLQVAFDQQEGLLGEDWGARTEARYYFDAPAGEVDLAWSLRAEPVSFDLPGYQVGVLDSNWFSYPGMYSPFSWGAQMNAGDAETDTAGFWEIEGQLTNLDRYEAEVTLPANYTLEVTAQDETGFPVTNRAGMLVHPSQFYIGVQPSAWLVQAGEEVEFDLLVVDWEKDPDGEHDLRAEFSKVTWDYEIGDIGQYDYTREKELIRAESFTTDREGKASLRFVPEEPGTYQLDVFGNGARTEISLWVGGPGTTPWPRQANQKIKLVPDQESYLPGDTASVFIPNPFPDGAQALITLERNRVVSYETDTITDSGKLLEIKLDESDAPNIYLSVTLIGEDPEGRADFRQGYLNLLVLPEDKLLAVEVIGEPERLGPGEEVEFTIRVTDDQGQPQQGEFSLAIVDQAVLALADPYSPDIEEAFYGTHPLSVRMGFPLGMHAGLIVFVPGGMGGGGGDLQDSVRDQFEDTGYWQADIVTDENGLAVVSVSLPDNLTTWQADARGVTRETRVGQAGTEVVTTKDLLIRPATPRFLVAGDHLALAAVVHNNTGTDLTAEISLQSSGLLLDNPEFTDQIVDVPAGGRTRVEWWATVEDTDQADLLFLAEAGQYQDAVKPYQGPIPVLRYLSPVTFGTSGVLDQAGEELEIVSLPRSYDPRQGSLEIELAPSLAGAILSALDALEDREPYSTEASLSTFLPNLITYQTLKNLELDYPLLESRLEELIPETLDLVASAQNEDGGWGWYPGSASDPEISSYILFGLLQAQDAGVFVDDILVQNGIGYLMATLPAVDMVTDTRGYDRLALRYFVLTEAGINVQAGMEALAELGSQLSPGQQGLLAVSLETAQPGSQWAQSLLSNLGGSGIRSATGLHWENSPESGSWMHSDTTSTAMATYALARSGMTAESVPEAVRYLVSARTRQGDWWSAYETSWAVLALNEVLQASGELTSDFSYSAAVNGTELISGTARGPIHLDAAGASLPLSNLYPEDPNALVIERSEGSGSLYYKAHLLVYRPADEILPYGRELSLSRVYADLPEGGAGQFTQTGLVGDLIQVQLTLVLEHDTHYLALEDHLPAGAEILDTRLKTSRQDLQDFQAAAPFQEGWGWWYFNSPQVYDQRIRWTASFLPAGTYQIQYTLSLTHPGEFQVLPAHAWQVYFPETAAVSAGDRFVIESGD